MAAAEIADVYLETVETDKDEVRQPAQIGPTQTKSVGIRRKGYRHTSNSFIPSTTITNDRLKAGYIFFSDCYKSLTTAY